MTFGDLVPRFGEACTDPEEEIFLLFSSTNPPLGLGIQDPSTSVINVAVGQKEYSISQSPTLLASSRQGGTTGAVLWKVTPFFAEWLSSPSNVLFEHGILGPTSIVLELGTGVSGLVAMTLESKIMRYIATDQDYILKVLRQNLSENLGIVRDDQKSSSRKQKGSMKRSMKTAIPSTSHGGNIQLLKLDWEADHVSEGVLHSGDNQDPSVKNSGLDLVIACDCVYNEALIEPFVNTCKDLCALRASSSHTVDLDHKSPTLCIVAMQLRTPDVMGSWLTSFHRHFKVWRLSDELLSSNLSTNSGFVVFLGFLRHSWPADYT